MLEKNLLRKNDTGASIVEMLGVLAIMGMITVAGIQGYNKAVGSLNRNKVIEQVASLVQEVRSTFSTRVTYNETDEADGGYDIGNNVLRKKKVSLVTPYGGEYSVTSVGKEGNNPGFVISLDNIPASDCTEYQIRNWDGAMDSTMQHISNVAYFGAGSSSGSSVGTIDPVTGLSCGDGDNNIMSVYFK